MTTKKRLAGLVVLGALAAPELSADDTAISSGLAGAFEAVQDSLDLLIPGALKEDDFRLRLGAGFGTLPDYRGSDDYRLKVLPIIDIRYKDRLRLTHNRLSYALVKSGDWSFGPLVKYKRGRREKRNPILAGLGDIKATAELGLFTKYRTDRMLFNVEVRHALGAGQGSSVRATLGHAIFKSGKFAAAALVRAKWLSTEAMQTNFGITAEQAERSEAGLPAFAASSGVSELSFNLMGRYQVSEKYRLLGLLGYGRLMGDAADSPLVTGPNGSRNQFVAGVGFTIDF